MYAQYQEGGALGLSTYTNPPREMVASAVTEDIPAIEAWGNQALADWAAIIVGGSYECNHIRSARPPGGPNHRCPDEAINQQIPSIQTIYPTPTDATPDNNSVQFPYEVCLDDTQYPGMMRVNMNLYITHVFKRARLDTVYAQMQPYIYPWLMVLSAWRNQYLTPDTGFSTQISAR